MRASDYTESLTPAQTDFLTGYATGGGTGSDRRYQIGNLFKTSTALAIGTNANATSGIEIGDTANAVATTPFIDFHAGATPVDFDARIIVPSGSGVSGGGPIQIVSPSFGPTVNDASTLGTGALSFADLFLASGGTINFNNSDHTLVDGGSGLLSAIMSNAAGVVLNLQNNDAGAVGALLDLYHNSASPAVSDITSAVRGFAMSSTGVKRQLSSINTVYNTTTNAAEAAQMDFYVITGGSLSNVGLRLLDRSTIIGPGTAIPAGGNASLGYRATSTTTFGIYFGSGVPTLSANAGSLYLRSDGSSTSTRAYICQGGTTWTNLVTAA